MDQHAIREVLPAAPNEERTIEYLTAVNNL